MDPITVSIAEAMKITNIGRSFIYQRLADGSIKATKAGKKTLISFESLKTYMASLPDAVIKQSPAARKVK